jgi:hypothetical protein
VPLDELDFYAVDPAQAERVAQSEGPLPPIICNGHGWVTDGDHRAAGAQLRGNWAITALKAV